MNNKQAYPIYNNIWSHFLCGIQLVNWEHESVCRGDAMVIMMNPRSRWIWCLHTETSNVRETKIWLIPLFASVLLEIELNNGKSCYSSVIFDGDRYWSYRCIAKSTVICHSCHRDDKINPSIPFASVIDRHSNGPAVALCPPRPEASTSTPHLTNWPNWEVGCIFTHVHTHTRL